MIKKKAVSAMIWSVVGQIGTSGISMLFTLVFARLLTPSDYGVFAAGLLVTSLGAQLSLLGLNTALVQRKDVNTVVISTAFWLALGATTLTATIIMALSHPISRWFGDPRISSIMAPLALGMILSATCAILTARFTRELNIKFVASRALVANLLSGAAATPLAFHGFGAVALVVQNVGGVALSLIATIQLTGWPIRMQFDRAIAKAMLTYGTPVMMSDTLNSFNMESPKLFVGFFLGTGALGIFSMASRILNMLLVVLASTLSSVAFPVFSEVHRSAPERVYDAYLRLFRLAAAAYLPIFLVGAVLSGPLVTVLLGPKWADAAAVSAYLCLAGVPLGLAYINGALVLALGRPQLRLFFVCLSAVISVAALTVVTRYGLVWVGAALLIRSVFTEPLMTWRITKILGGAFPRDFAGLKIVALGSVVLVVFASLCRLVLGGAPALVVVAATSLIALASYAAVIWRFGRSIGDEMVSLVLRRASS